MIVHIFDFIMLLGLVLFAVVSYKEVKKQLAKDEGDRGVSRFYVIFIGVLVFFLIFAPVRFSEKNESVHTIKTFDKEPETSKITIERQPIRHYTTSDNERVIEIITKERNTEDE